MMAGASSLISVSVGASHRHGRQGLEPGNAALDAALDRAAERLGMVERAGGEIQVPPWTFSKISGVPQRAQKPRSTVLGTTERSRSRHGYLEVARAGAPTRAIEDVPTAFWHMRQWQM